MLKFNKLFTCKIISIIVIITIVEHDGLETKVRPEDVIKINESTIGDTSEKIIPVADVVAQAENRQVTIPQGAGVRKDSQALPLILPPAKIESGVEGTAIASATEQATTNLATAEGVTIGITKELQTAELLSANVTVTQSLDSVILFDGNEVYEKLGSFYTAYTGKTEGEIFIVVAVDVSQKETLETELRDIGLNLNSDDLNIWVLKGPAFAMLGKAEELGDFKVIRGTKIDDIHRNLRDAVTSI